MDRKHALGGALIATLLAPAAAAQFDQQWVKYTLDNTHLGPTPLSISNNTTSLPGDTPSASLMGIETDVAWGDLDKDGWTDLVIVRKQPFTSAGKRTNLLLMNENGVLVDRTTQYASAADVPGDQGFNTPTNDRDVAFVDVDNDTWLDVVVATTLSDADPKHIGHPRVYMNLGVDGSGAWLGLRFEDARIPQLFSFSTGQPQNPRFCSVAAGDVTGDGYADLFFGDYDSSGAGGVGEPAGGDLNDRLLINDGHGFFSDQSQLRMSPDMLLSAFSMASIIRDFNGDGMNDVAKDTALNPPQDVRIVYNNPANEGFFQIQDKFHTLAPYHINTGDLNQDGRLDMVFSDDNQDRFRVNMGNDVLGRVIWSAPHTYNFLSGGDDGFGSDNLIADLDNDGWDDVLICDVDVDIPGGNRRLHIYHNLGGTVGGDDLVLREERQSTSSTGWIGVVGMTDLTMKGAHDIAVFDVDNDLDLDIVFSRMLGTDVYIHDGGVTCQKSIGFGGPGHSALSVCGGDLASVGASADVRLQGAPASSPAIFALGNVASPTALVGGFLVPFPPLAVAIATTDAQGGITIPAAFNGNGSGLTFYLQAATLDTSLPGQWDISNAVQLDF